MFCIIIQISFSGIQVALNSFNKLGNCSSTLIGSIFQAFNEAHTFLNTVSSGCFNHCLIQGKFIANSVTFCKKLCFHSLPKKLVNLHNCTCIRFSASNKLEYSVFILATSLNHSTFALSSINFFKSFLTSLNASDDTQAASFQVSVNSLLFCVCNNLTLCISLSVNHLSALFSDNNLTSSSNLVNFFQGCHSKTHTNQSIACVTEVSLYSVLILSNHSFNGLNTSAFSLLRVLDKVL
jgi:hypothetical protein